ncbi:MAG: CsgG/HfaB family protein, partial [Elusimicrobiota bacterium]|nr:CsgG/HfaB family protein [Elusimicrobiota bacterium]
ASDASIVSDLLRTELVKIGKFKVLDRANMESILAEQKFQISGCTDQECAVKIGKLLNVQQVVVGTFLEKYYILQ